ncbi:MAG: serine/threonine-protein kinase [Bryobacteraceae bacterium]|jgi:serine/threonine-protein kinase
MIGKQIGNYRIVEKLGEGGMGIVYKAMDTALDRPVAVKALSAALSQNPALVERFRGEARAQAQMNHPNLATLYAFLVEDGAAYMVMEFVEGENFAQIVARRGPIPAAEALPLFLQALSGIGYAHRLGIVHRDIKPSNMMLNRDGIVKVMDFGLAKVIGDRGLTRTGVQVGTVCYMSPEQVLNKPVDIRSDIYSLGATLFEILTEHLPFKADSEFHMMNAHVNTPPPPPTGFNARIPQSVEDAVLKALAKDPDARFQTVEEFAAALGHPQDFHAAVTRVDGPRAGADSVIEPPTSPGIAPVAQPKPAFWTRPRKLTAAGVVVIVALLAGWLIFRPKPQAAPLAPPSTAVAEPPSAVTPPPAAAPAPPPVPTQTIPAGTVITVTTVDPIDGKNSAVGQEFRATVAVPVLVGGSEAISRGDDAGLRLQETANAGHSKSEPMLELTSITTGDKKYQVSTTPYLIKKHGIRRSERVDKGTRIQFKLRSSVSVTLQP